MNVYLIGESNYYRGAFDPYLAEMGVTFESDATNPQYELVEIAGRICYQSWEKMRPAKEGMTRNETYIRHILTVDHGSVLEHVSFNFILTGIDRMVSHELVRHRVGTAFSQTSTRYVDQFEHKLGFVPRKQLEGDFGVLNYFDHAEKIYKRTIEKLKADGIEGKKAREIAATLLPGAIQTQMVFSVNLRELRHILKMRASTAANAAIRELAMRMYQQIVMHWPVFVCDFKVVETPDGIGALEWEKLS